MLRIIIVEDEYRARTGLAKMINNFGENYQVVAIAENGYEGMQLAQQYKPDVIFTDIQMPRVNGLEMIEHLVSTEYDCRFVIISGYADFEYARKGIRLGVTDYLLKPITMSAVQSLLQKIEKEFTPKPDAATESESANYSSMMINKIVKDIERHYMDKLSLEKYAQEHLVTPEYLSTLFSKQVGQPFVRYLKERRIEHAKEMLSKSNKKIYQIAFDVGYTDIKYFCRIFKETTGVSAREYTRQAVQKRID